MPSNTWSAYELEVFPKIESCEVFLATPAILTTGKIVHRAVCKVETFSSAHFEVLLSGSRE